MTTSENNYYAVYLFSTNRHHSGSGSGNVGTETVKQQIPEKDSIESKTSDSEDSSVCLSLVETNLSAEQETVVRCYFLKSFSVKENLNFENEGKYVALKLSEDEKQTFGCYYHLLSKNCNDNCDKETRSNQLGNHCLLRKLTFVVCLIGKSVSVMESFCCELGAFCCRILPLLDSEGIDNKKDVQKKLENWYCYCVEYIERCLQSFKEDIGHLLQSALYGKVNIVCHDEDVQWDLERLVEACTLNDVLPVYAADCKSSNSALSNSDLAENVHSFTINLQVTSHRLTPDTPLVPSSFCFKWVERLLSCNSSDVLGLRSLLENFRLKAIQDLNTLRRLLRRAENDYYSLFRAYKFLINSGYQDILLHHVRQEATVTCSQDSLEVIDFLSNFTKMKQQAG